jgi:hypothetical protein
VPLNPDRAGHHYPAFTYEVGREKVREFAHATFVEGPDRVRIDADAGELSSDEVVAPSAFAASVTGRVIPMVVDDPELGGHWNLLHTAQRFDFHRPIRVGDVLRCAPSIADLQSRARMERLTIEVDVTDAADDSPVFTAASTLVFFAQEADA